MTERRFWFVIDDGKLEYVQDLVTGEKITVTDLEDLLNEQQAIINEQNEAIDYLKTVIRYTLPNQMVADVFKQIGEEYE